MNRVLLMVTAMLAMATGVQAKNQVYGVERNSMVSEGYRLFASDTIVDTVYRTDKGTQSGADYCKSVDENTSKNLGDANSLRSDTRLPIGADAKLSYAAACMTYNSVVDQLKTADDVRRLWLLFGDSATDEFAVETSKDKGYEDERSLLIETKRLAIVSKYLEFFTKNKEWKLTDYTFLSQAFKSRKGKPLSPAYSQFIVALLTGDTAKAIQVVKSIDLDNLGNRFAAPGPGDSMKQKGADLRN